MRSIPDTNTRLAIGNHVDNSNVGDDNFNKVHIPDGTLTPRQKRRQRRKYCKTVQREERKKRRKVIEDLIRLEGELNSGMGTYAMAFDTDSQPVIWEVVYLEVIYYKFDLINILQI